jgi:5'-3' exonuclease
MGVDGFWPIVSSKGKRVTIDILSDKVIAIDASIWIYQFANALRDSTGEPIRSSHIVGFFKRICKLLYLRIKPVFVFDGPPIPLKFEALRKRREDTVSDSMVKRAARQLLLQNLRQIQANPNVQNETIPILQRPDEDDDSVDEIYVVTDSSSDDGGMSPSRRLRLSVPAAFRGFVAERRTLDSVSLPISPERPVVREDERKYFEVEARIDEEALKDLPLHEQYRSLLETRTALLSQGRRKALTLASKMGSSMDFADLDKLSMDQIKAVVDLARVTDLSKTIRMQMSRDENKDEVYIPGNPQQDSRAAETSEVPAKRKKKRKAGTDQFYLESEYSDRHSVLSSARQLSRDILLFDKKPDDGTSSVKLETSEMKLEEIDRSSEEEISMSNLFGAEWNDLIQRTESPAIHTKPELVPPMRATESPDTSTKPEFVPPMRVTESPAVHSKPELVTPVQVFRAANQQVPESREEQGPNLEEISSAVSSSYEESEISIEVDSVSETEPGPIKAVETTTARPVASDMTIDLADSAAPRLVHFVPEPADEISDRDLSDLADLIDPFPFFASDIEELAFDNHVRERINVVENLDNTYEEIQQLLTAFGIPWVSAPADAEAQCAFLAHSGLTDGVISDDSDTLVYGSPVVFRHLYIGDSTVEIYRLNEMGFNKEELISLALLLGCDFTEGVRGIGPVNATEIVRHYSGIAGLKRLRTWAERFVTDKGTEGEPIDGEDPEDSNLRIFKQTHANYRPQWLFPEDFPSQEVWDVFDKPLVDTSLEPFSWASPDETMICNVVTSLTSMREDEVVHLLQTTMNEYRQASTQRRITDYFSPAFERGSVAEVVSKRLKAALG